MFPLTKLLNLQKISFKLYLFCILKDQLPPMLWKNLPHTVKEISFLKAVSHGINSQGNTRVSHCGSHILLSCSTLSVRSCSNKHIHAGVISDLSSHSASSLLLRRWFIQPLTGGSLWTSEHIRRQIQEPSALIMSHHSVHGLHFHLSLSLSLSLSLARLHSFSFFLLYFFSSSLLTRKIMITILHKCLGTAW